MTTGSPTAPRANRGRGTALLLAAALLTFQPPLARAATGTQPAPFDPRGIASPGYFLSATNPSATTDQRDLLAKSLRILAMPAVQQAKAQAAARWHTIVGHDGTPEAWSLFDDFMNQYAFGYVQKAVNGDPQYPKVLSDVFSPAHDWFGMQVPGSRSGGGPGPDARYVAIPVEYGAHYRLTGRRSALPPADVVYTLTGNLGFTMTLGSLLGRDIKSGPDGTYTIAIGPEPSAGRPNTIQTLPDVRYLFIRDCRADWRQVPDPLYVQRLDPPTRPPLTDDQIAQRAGAFMVDDVSAMFWFMRVFDNLKPNTITPPFSTGSIGGLVSQRISFAHLYLKDDDAFVITLGAGHAAFHDLVLHNFWFNTPDFVHHTASMTNNQATPNPDGTITYVISIKDPGVHNWMDPVGLHELLVVNRWQGLPGQQLLSEAPSAQGRLVKLKDLPAVLPKTALMVTPQQRQQQLAERLATYQLRYVDH